MCAQRLVSIIILNAMCSEHLSPPVRVSFYNILSEECINLMASGSAS